MMGLLHKLFPKRLLFVILSPNRLSIRDMESGTLIDRKSAENFSVGNELIGNLKVAEGFIRTMIKEVLSEIDKHGKPVKVVLQINEKRKEEILPEERRIYRDVFEHAGAASVNFIEYQNEVSASEVLAIGNK